MREGAVSFKTGRIRRMDAFFDDRNALDRAAEIFRGFGNPVRLRVIGALRGGGLRVKDIGDAIGCPQPIVSQQLKILRSAGIVKRTREGDTWRYCLANPHYADMLACIRGSLEL